MNIYHVLGTISVSVSRAVNEALTGKRGQSESNGRWLCMGSQESFLLGDFEMWADYELQGKVIAAMKAVGSIAGVGRSDWGGNEVLSTDSLGRLVTKPHKNFEYYPRYDEWGLILNFQWLFTYMPMCVVLRSQKSLYPLELELHSSEPPNLSRTALNWVFSQPSSARGLNES